MQQDKSEKTILFIDDEEWMINSLIRLIRHLPYRIVKATCGEEGLKLARTEHPDLIFLDVRMVKMDGYEVLRSLREQNIQVPVVMLTAAHSQEEIKKGYGEGSVYYITKPFKKEYVVNIIQYLIGDLTQKEREALELSL